MKKVLNVSDETVDEFLDDFLTKRIGTDILSSHYLAITGPGARVIDPECDPVMVVKAARAEAVRLCKYHYKFAPPVNVVDIGPIRFPFIPQYLNYIIFELLKNSLRAVVLRHGKEGAPANPIKIVVCGDASTVVIRISDA